jgi:hypothetical protein
MRQRHPVDLGFDKVVRNVLPRVCSSIQVATCRGWTATQLYDRRHDEMSLDEVERIRV